MTTKTLKHIINNALTYAYACDITIIDNGEHITLEYMPESIRVENQKLLCSLIQDYERITGNTYKADGKGSIKGVQQIFTNVEKYRKNIEISNIINFTIKYN